MALVVTRERAASAIFVLEQLVDVLAAQGALTAAMATLARDVKLDDDDHDDDDDEHDDAACVGRAALVRLAPLLLMRALPIEAIVDDAVDATLRDALVEQLRVRVWRACVLLESEKTI